MASIVRTQLKKSLNVKQRSINLQNEVSKLKAEKRAKLKLKASEEQNELPMIDYELRGTDAHTYTETSPSPKFIPKKRIPTREGISLEFQKEIKDIACDKFELLQPNCKINPPKTTPLNALKRIKNFQETIDNSLTQHSFDPSDALFKSKTIKTFNSFHTPSPYSKVYATPDMPMAKSQYELKGTVTELQLSTSLSVQTLPIFKGDFFQLDYFPPEHIVSHFRKSRPALKVQYKDGFLLNDVEFDKKYNGKNSALNKSYYPRDYAFIRWKWRRLVKSIFFKEFQKLDGLDGFYLFRVKLYPNEEDLMRFTQDIKDGLLSAKKKEAHCQKVAKKHNSMVDPRQIDNAISMNDFPPLMLLPGVELKQSRNGKLPKNIIQSPRGGSEAPSIFKSSQGKPSNIDKQLVQSISDVLNSFDDGPLSTPKPVKKAVKIRKEPSKSLDYSLAAEKAQEKRYEDAKKMVGLQNSTVLSTRMRELLKHIKL